jgi:hypothetical protein
VPQEMDELGVEAAAWSADRQHDFDAWVCDRLADWTSSEIRAFERWLRAESRLEFIPAVRAAGEQKLFRM